jgi:Tol biopolymer transport system component
MNALLLALALAPAQPPGDWKEAEKAHLSNITQLTFDFVRAGEGYFSPDGTKIIFQAEEKDTGNPFYQMFVMDLKTKKAVRVSPGVGETTCGYFHPSGQKVIWASTHGDPDAKTKQAEEIKQREDERKNGTRRRYAWRFDPHMKIYESNLDGTNLKCLTPDAKVYTAEGSYSADGKKIVYSAGNARNVQLFTMDADGKNAKRLTDAPNCYNGGPFFSPDGKRVVFRADRKEQDRLQLYAINADGTGEKALTAEDKWVFWAPYWYKDGQHIIYTAADHSNEMMRPNYDLYWMDLASGKRTQVTFAPGADVLPVFSPDYTKVMWTRSPDGRSPSQLFVADFTPPKDK